MMTDWINEYIESKKNAWSETTLRSESSRLRATIGASSSGQLVEGCPQSLWDSLAGKGSYTRVTTFTRVCSFYDFLITRGYKQGTNPFRSWRTNNAKLFRNAYKPRFPELSFDEAEALIGRIEDGEVREKCRELLRGGLRYTESLSRDGELITGKGGKVRRAYVPGTSYSRSYDTVLRALKKHLGVTTHSLRKIRATQLANTPGVTPFDLCHIFGWSDPKTALSYVKSGSKKLESIMKGE